MKTASILLLLVPWAVFAHHSRIEFADGEIHEIEGEIVTVFWQNPHAHFTVRTAGDEAVWDLESADIVTLTRRGVPRGTVSVGQRVRVAGFRSARRDHYLDVTNVLLPGGTEVVFSPRAGARWSDDIIGVTGETESTGTLEAESDAPGIFRVWTRTRTNLPELDELPLTDAARAAHEAYDPLTDDPILSCTTPGMPRSMTFAGPHPIEFVDAGDEIVLRLEYFNHVRRIHMDVTAPAGGEPETPLGYSVGRWEGDALVVTTTRVSWPYFDLNAPLLGFPQSGSVEIVERFKLRDDGSELAYDITVTDPVTFTESLELTDYLVWGLDPGMRIEPYDCSINDDLSPQ